MTSSKLIIVSSLTIAFASLAFGALTVQAQIIIIPDCDENPQQEFCQGQCQFVEPLPSWCEPPEPETDPVVIVPGMLSSVNFKATFQDEEGGAWDFFPYFGNVYRGLTERLEAAGFTEGQDLFIAHYDWRQSNDESANVDQVDQDQGIKVSGTFIASADQGGSRSRCQVLSSLLRDNNLEAQPG